MDSPVTRGCPDRFLPPQPEASPATAPFLWVRFCSGVQQPCPGILLPRAPLQPQACLSTYEPQFLLCTGLAAAFLGYANSLSLLLSCRCTLRCPSIPKRHTPAMLLFSVALASTRPLLEPPLNLNCPEMALLPL